MTRAAYLNLAGQYENIGDGIIRRRTLDWVRGAREVHVYVGAAPQEWVTQLQLDPGSRVYRTDEHSAWMRGALRAGRRSLVVLAPGEVFLRSRELPRELKLLGLAAVLRLRGGALVSPPRHTRFNERPAVAVHRLTARLSRSAMWRTRATAEMMRVGLSLPDIGFDETPVEGLPWQERSTLMVSMRGPRPFPSEAWVEGVRAFADRAGLRVQTFAQVRLDEQRAAELAERLGGEHLAWGERDLLAHEQVLRRAYGGARLVVSDRLHVVIMAMLSGAMVAEVADRPSPKVSDHLAQIGLGGVTLDSSSTDAAGVVAHLEHLVTRRQEFTDALAAGRAQLAAAHRNVRALLQPRAVPA